MKFLSKWIAIIILMAGTGSLLAQEQEVIIYPDKDAGLWDLDRTPYGGLNYRTMNSGSSPEFYVHRWTWSTWYIKRALIEFNLSQIPENAVITEATLTLSGVAHNPLQRSNESYLYRINQAWTENVVTWENQPTVIENDKAYLHASTSPTEVYNVDLKTIVQSWIDGYYPNYGLMLKLANETTTSYTKLEFASSDHTNPAMRPKLTIKYILPYKVTINPTKDAYVRNLNYTLNKVLYDYRNTNYGNTTTFLSGEQFSNAWYNQRGLIEFDLSTVPANVEIAKAKLTLNGYSHQYTRPNESKFYRINNSWTENQVTWNNQPAVVDDSTTIYMPTSTSTSQIYKVDVRRLIDGWYRNAFPNYGIMLKLVTESPATHNYARMQFYSSEYSTTTVRPKLEVYYVYKPIAANIVVKHADFDTLGSCQVMVTGGLPPYTITWSNGVVSDKIINCLPGNYTANIVDSLGTEHSISAQVCGEAKWLNLTYTTQSNDTLKRINGKSLWDAGAESSEYILAGSQGQIEYKTESVLSNKIVGFSPSNLGYGISTYKYAFLFESTKIKIIENGTTVADVADYSSGIKCVIRMSEDSVYYIVNSVIKRTSPLAGTEKLVGKTSLYTVGSIISNVKVIGSGQSNMLIDLSGFSKGFNVILTGVDKSDTLKTGQKNATWVKPITSQEVRTYTLDFLNVSGQKEDTIKFDINEALLISNVKIKLNGIWVDLDTSLYSVHGNALIFETNNYTYEPENQAVPMTINLLNDEIMSPNGDGQYDTFFVTISIPHNSYTIKIKKLNGTIVHQSNASNDVWNGNDDNTGIKVPVGTYVYEIVLDGVEIAGLFNITY